MGESGLFSIVGETAMNGRVSTLLQVIVQAEKERKK